MSVVGQEAGIEHGTPRGLRQHRRRKVPDCEECLAAVREVNRERYGGSASLPATGARKTAHVWNGGMAGDPPAPEARPLTGECPTPGCGKPEPAPGLVRVEVAGSRASAAWYCPGWCERYGQALAEIRAIDA